MTLLQLDIPLVVFDTETTGTNTKLDRVCQIGLVKLYPNGERKEWQTLVDPETPIPPEATAIHHITDEMVQGKPKFAEIAPTLVKGLKMCDYAGFNLAFDIRILTAEFERAKVNFEFNGRILDAMKIFHRYEKRDLSAAVMFYLNKKHEDAHGALPDTVASLEVLEAQLERYLDLPRTVEGLYKLFYEIGEDGLDPDKKIVWKFGKACMNFGKHSGVSLDKVPTGYLRWLKEDKGTTPSLRQIVSNVLEGKYPVKP